MKKYESSMSRFHDLDTVKILVPVSGTSSVKEEPAAFPAGTEGVVVSVGKDGGLVEIGWAAPDGLSCDGLLVPLRDEQMEVVEAYAG